MLLYASNQTVLVTRPGTVRHGLELTVNSLLTTKTSMLFRFHRHHLQTNRSVIFIIDVQGVQQDATVHTLYVSNVLPVYAADHKVHGI